MSGLEPVDRDATLSSTSLRGIKYTLHEYLDGYVAS